MLDTKELNENQQMAVQWDKGPLLVLAGPGSGKTFVLTRRIAHLIDRDTAARFRVLGLTFTTKAADEMHTRVKHFLGANTSRARLTTFHSFCTEVLRQHGSHLGLKPDFEILSQDMDRLPVLNDAIREADVPNMPLVNDQGIIKMIDHLLREGHDPVADTPLLGKTWVRPIYHAYLNLQLRHNHLDFGSLLVCCLRLFRDHPRIAKHYQIVYPYICVDEYQDTNKCQDMLLRALCPGTNANLFVVADDDQIIYQWNGASPERLEKLRSEYNMQVIQLPESFRCPPEVIRLANALIHFNQKRSPDKKPLTSVVMEQSSSVVCAQHFHNESAEMDWVARNIRERNLPLGECVVLARNTKLLQVAATSLQKMGLAPYRSERKSEFEYPLLCFVHSALRLANAPQNHEQIGPLCKAFYDLTDVNVRVDDAEAESGVNGGSLLRGFLDAAQSNPMISPDSQPLLTALGDQLIERLKYQEFVRAVFAWSKGRNQPEGIDKNHDEEAQEMNVWHQLSHEIRQHFSDPTLSQFLQELDLHPKVRPPKPNEVQCLTIHQAKGKEFRHVYLVGLAEDQLPSYYARQKGNASREIEEERRNCFVAITRAQSSLTLTFADRYFGWQKQPSRFLCEMGLPVSA